MSKDTVMKRVTSFGTVPQYCVLVGGFGDRPEIVIGTFCSTTEADEFVADLADMDAEGEIQYSIKRIYLIPLIDPR